MKGSALTMVQKLMLGERPINHAMKCNIDNYKNFENCIDQIVI